MKGIVFTEFIDMVEDQFGLEIMDNILEETDLPSGGAYTSVGTYDHKELVQMVIKLSQMSNLEIPVLLTAFGKYLFTKFVEGYPSFFEGISSAFDFLENVEDYIHVEVLKLYPDAELPRFECERLSDEQLSMIYHSPRCLGHFAEGLMQGCVQHYEESIEINMEPQTEDGSQVRFLLTKQTV